MPIYGIKRTKVGRWAIIFREGGNALFQYKAKWVEAPVLKDGSIDDTQAAEGELAPLNEWEGGVDEDQLQAMCVLSAFRGAVRSTEEIREGKAPWRQDPSPRL